MWQATIWRSKLWSEKAVENDLKPELSPCNRYESIMKLMSNQSADGRSIHNNREFIYEIYSSSRIYYESMIDRSPSMRFYSSDAL